MIERFLIGILGCVVTAAGTVMTFYGIYVDSQFLQTVIGVLLLGLGMAMVIAAIKD